jgi:ketosteroid isomerase-like protein
VRVATLLAALILTSIPVAHRPRAPEPLAAIARSYNGGTPQSRRATLTVDSAIRARRQDLNKAIASRDTLTMKAIFDDSARFVSQAAVFLGKSELADHYAGFFGRMRQEHRLLTLAFEPARIELSAHENFAAESGTFAQHWEEGPGFYEELHGPYFAVWHMVNGQWQLLVQAWTPLNCGPHPPDCNF